MSHDLSAFSNIHHTPAWYWKRWPGFFNVESYEILAKWDKGVRSEEEWLRDQELECGVEECKDGEMQYSQNGENKKRKTYSVEERESSPVNDDDEELPTY